MFKALGRFLYAVWDGLFHLTVKKRVRTFMLCWTGFFSCYEVAMIALSDSPLFHVPFLILQVTFLAAYIKAKAV